VDDLFHVDSRIDRPNKRHSGLLEAMWLKPSAAIQHDTEEIDDRHDSEIRKQVIWISPALGIGIFLSAIDQTIVASAYGEIGSDLKALNNSSWIATV
jgi:hypothetical protein